MKNIFFKTFVLIFILIAINILPVSAQKKITDNNQQHGGYKFENGSDIHKDYVDKILTKKMKLMQHYFSVLIEKKELNYIKAIDSAMLLFNNDETKLVTITSKNTGKVYVKPVKEYLTDISKLPYKSVDITYRNYTAIENIRKQPDGLYKGVAVFQQEFTGFDKEGKAMYHDIITRNVEVVIKFAHYIIKEKHLVSMDIFFGNMGVTEM